MSTMGQTSSQIQASQAQDQSQQLLEGVSASTPRLDGAADDMAEDAPAGKKRKVSAQGGQAAKRKKKDRTASAQEREANADGQNEPESRATAPIDVPADEPTIKVMKRKTAKKAAADVARDLQPNDQQTRPARNNSPRRIPPETQEPPPTQPEIADSQMEPNAQGASQYGKKGKKKKATGRKSGLNLAPAVLPEPEALEVPDTQAGAEDSSGPVEKAEATSPSRREAPTEDFQFRRLSKRSADAEVQAESEEVQRRASDADAGDAAAVPVQKPKAKKRKKAKAASSPVEDRVGQDPLIMATSQTQKKRTPKHLRPIYETDTEEEEETRMQQAEVKKEEPVPKQTAEDTKEQKNKRKALETTNADNARVKPKARRGAGKAVENEGDMGIPPTPPVATQDALEGSSTSAPAAREAPTPPTSISGSGGLREDYSEVDATDQVAGWLDSQPEAGLAPVPSSRNATPEKRRKSKPEPVQSATKQNRRRKSAMYDDDSDEFQPEDQENVAPEADSVPRDEENKRRKKSKKDAAEFQPIRQVADSDDEVKVKRPLPANKNQSAAPQRDDDAIAKGPFTEAERNTVDDIFATMLKDSSMNESDFRASIQTWREATEFKQAVHEALPHRPKPAIRKFCQRRYHNLERGAWSAEDDDSLRRAHAANPGAWTQISALVGRTAADCKDRWKNSLMLEKTMQLGPWSQDEETALTKAVDDCVKEIKEANKGDKALTKDRAKMEGMISWATVAEKLGGTRSAKRCNEKWQRMKHRAHSTAYTQPPIATGANAESQSKKLRQAAHRYNKCGAGDHYDILTEIHTAIPDHEQDYALESTFWSRVAVANPKSRFDSAMRRRGFYDAQEKFKDDVPAQRTMAGTAKALADHLEERLGLEGLQDQRKWVPKKRAKKEKAKEDDEAEEEQLEVARPPFAKPPREKPSKKSAQQAAKAFKSAEKVEHSESEEEEDEGEEAEPEAEIQSSPSPDRKRRFSRGKRQPVEDVDDSPDELAIEDSQPTPRGRKPEKSSDMVTVSSIPSADSEEMAVREPVAKRGKTKTMGKKR